MKIDSISISARIFGIVFLSIFTLIFSYLIICIKLKFVCVLLIITLYLLLLLIFAKNEYHLKDGKITWIKKGLFIKKITSIDIVQLKILFITKTRLVGKYTFGYQKNFSGKYVYTVLVVENLKNNPRISYNDSNCIKSIYRNEFYIELNYSHLFEKFINQGFSGDIYLLEEDYNLLEEDLKILIDKGVINSEKIRVMK